MRLPRSLHWRIALAYTALIIVTMGLVSIYLVGLVRSTFITNPEERSQQEASLVSEASVAYLGSSPDLTSLQNISIRNGEILGARVTITSADGLVLADNQADPTQMQGRPAPAEVRVALARGFWQGIQQNDALDSEMLVTTVPIQDNGTLLGFARVSVPTSQVQQNVNRLVSTITLSAVVVAFLSIALGYLLFRRTSRSVQLVAEGANRLAQGDLEHRVRSVSSDETVELAEAFNDMASTIRGMVSDLSGERNKLTAILDTMADGVVVIEADGQVALMNRTAEWLLDISIRHATGSRFVEMVRDHELQELVSRSLETNQIWHDEIELLHGRFLSAIATPLTDNDSEGVMLTLHDLTSVRQVETTRKEFVTNVSHELRSPLASVKAMVETLSDGAIDDQNVAKDFLQRINREVDRMNNMVNELLELSRLESGQELISFAPVDIRPLIEEVISEYQDSANSKGVSLEMELPEGQMMVTGEGSKLRQVLVNLLENALKHTADGSVTISAGGDESTQEVRVSDTGHGIPREHLPHVFERFYKVDRARRDGGTGLGLAIAKHIVQSHGGDVQVESEEGVGSTFSFTLPRAN